jgi:hypothetical protein
MKDAVPEFERQQLDKRDEQRSAFLYKPCQLGGEDECRAIPLDEFLQHLDLGEPIAERTTSYLKNGQLIEIVPFRGSIATKVEGEE